MTETHTDYADDTLRLRLLPGGEFVELRITRKGNPSPSVEMTPARLLAMIDAAAPDAMSAYIRETIPAAIISEEPVPEAVTVNVHGVEPSADEIAHRIRRFVNGDAAARIDAVPEADSPEDEDERPTPATTERLALLEQVRDLYPNLPPYRHIGVVHWLLEGTELSERVERRLDRSVR